MSALNKNTKTFIFSILVLFAILFALLPNGLQGLGWVALFVMVVLALLFDILAFSVKYYDFLFFPFLHMKKRTAVISNEDPFYISSAGNTIVVRREEGVYASAFVKIPIYASASEMQAEDKLEFAMNFARLASLAKTPVRISTQMYIVNKDEYIKKITDKLNHVQDTYNQIINIAGTPPEKLERIKGEVTMWHNLFDNVSRAKAQTIAAYAMVTALGGTEEEATNLATIRGEELAAGISSTLGISASLAREEEILVLIEPDHMIPSRTVDEMMQLKGSSEEALV